MNVHAREMKRRKKGYSRKTGSKDPDGQRGGEARTASTRGKRNRGYEKDGSQKSRDVGRERQSRTIRGQSRSTVTSPIPISHTLCCTF